ncbi:MAG TPA: fumarate reductase/succinate dehydrogenase flavoprotein subunit, partial [Acidobacteriota bacterium]|nr:fumarate reductase/succinate dehydrogenase flavoprotein subunit [Acidobacteriota bacterium]
IPGLYIIGEANFSDHGANRLGASALMQGLADGYFILPYTIGDYLANTKFEKIDETHAGFQDARNAIETGIEKMLALRGKRTVDSFHRELGKLLWEQVGMARNESGLKQALERIPMIREEFHQNVNVLGENEELNQSLEKAGRVADFMELAELLAMDALHRKESCGGHFREEYQTPEGEALRDDVNFCYAAVWGYAGAGKPPSLSKEPMQFEYVPLTQRSYK